MSILTPFRLFLFSLLTITNKGNKLMCVRVNYGDPNKERGEIVKKEEQILKS